MKETMTPKERWLAAIRMKPVDRLPFWPKIDGSYPKRHGTQFQDMTLDAMLDWIGSDKHTWINSGIKETRRATAIETIQSGGVSKTIYKTPHGETALVCKFDEPSNSWHPVEFPVHTVETIKLMTEVFRDARLDIDPVGLGKSRAEAREIGRNALTACGMGTSPLMDWIQLLAGVENAHFFLIDHPAEVEELFEAMHQVILRKTKLLCEYSPADVLYLCENTSTTLISPEQYKRYCAPYIGEYARITSGADRNLILHMCGHLKALLPDLARIPAQGFEAFTSPTLGDTTLLDGRTQCPNTCLIGGTNAMLWTRTADEIIAQIKKDLDDLPHHRGIVLTSAGVMPPRCKPETIKRVCAWVKKYPARMNLG